MSVEEPFVANCSFDRWLLRRPWQMAGAGQSQGQVACGASRPLCLDIGHLVNRWPPDRRKADPRLRFCNIACDIIQLSMRLVLDTDVLVAAFRSERGASRELLIAALDERGDVLAALALVAEPVPIHFLWRPVLADSEDEHVLDLRR